MATTSKGPVHVPTPPIDEISRARSRLGVVPSARCVRVPSGIGFGSGAGSGGIALVAHYWPSSWTSSQTVVADDMALAGSTLYAVGGGGNLFGAFTTHLQPIYSNAITKQYAPGVASPGRVVIYDAETGKRREMTQTFETKKEAKNWAEVEAAKYREDPNRKPPSEETLGEYLNRWLNDVAAGRIRDTTLIAYRRYVKPVTRRAIAQKPLKSLTALDLQGVYTEMTKAGKAAMTVRHTHTVVRDALSDAVEWGMIPFNPADRAKPPKKTTAPVETAPTPDEARSLLEEADSHRLKALWYLLALSGCRRGEALGLRWSDIDESKRIIYIQRSLTSDGSLRSIHEPKTAQGRRPLAVTPYLLELLNQHQHQQKLEI